MKTKFLTLLLLLSAAVVSAETMRVAILEPVDRENKVSYATKLVLRSNLAKAVTNTAGYEAYDRTDIDAIVGEQNFQRTGMVSEDQIKRLGEMTGAKYILVAEAAIVDAQNMFITAKVLDVETARTVMTDNLMMGMEAKKIQEGCATLASNLFSSDDTNLKQKEITQEKKVIIQRNSSSDRRRGMKKYSYGDIQMNKKDLRASFNGLVNTCPEAYAVYKKSQKLYTIAKYTAIFSLGFGFVYYAPMFAVANQKLEQTIGVFNSQCASSTSLY